MSREFGPRYVLAARVAGRIAHLFATTDAQAAAVWRGPRGNVRVVRSVGQELHSDRFIGVYSRTATLGQIVEDIAE
jgi:predicted metalloprotease